MKYIKMSDIILVLFYTYWLVCGLPDEGLLKFETFWTCNVLTTKLHVDVVHVVGYK
jgi:hypothetical protein